MSDMPSDGDDGWIINATKQTRNDNGQVQFSIQMPSGRLVTSEWLSADNLRRALPIWLDTIKQQQAGEVEEARAEARRKAAARSKPAPQLVDASGDALSVEPRPSAIPSIGTQPLPSLHVEATRAAVSVSPDVFAKQGLEVARQTMEHWNGQAAIAMEKVLAAQADVAKWERILNAMNGTQGVSTSVESRSSNVGAGSVGTVRRKRRPKAERGSTVQSDDGSKGSGGSGERSGSIIVPGESHPL